MEERESLRDKVLADRATNIYYCTFEGVHSVNIHQFTEQPLEGMLYDINRDEATILANLDDPKWLNDYALTRLLKYYYNKCKELEERLDNYVKDNESDSFLV